MRRSTRLSIKRTNYTPDGFDEDGPEESKSCVPKQQNNKSTKVLPKKSIQQSGNKVEPIKVLPQAKANSINKFPNKKLKKDKKSDDGSSSESDIENYLQPADQIDLNSTFFTKLENKNAFEAIENNIFAGINRLSDSDSDSEFVEQKYVKTPKQKKTKIKNPKLSPIMNFQHVQDYAMKLEEAKKVVAKYEASKKIKRETPDKNLKIEAQNISNLLALGEAKLDSSIESQYPECNEHSSDYESFSESEKEDWEEVEERDLKQTQDNIVLPKDDLQISVELPTLMREKKGKDLVACMKRRLNRIRKQNQVLVHQIHLLCWIGHGNYINNILNDEGVLALVLSLIPTQFSYKSCTNLGNLEKILKWYKSTVANIEKRPPKGMALDKLLKLQIIRKEAFNKKMLVYIFVCLLRSLGIQCRLVISFQVAPLRPPDSELHSLSTKNNDIMKDVKKEKEEEEEEKMNDDENKIEIKIEAGMDIKQEKTEMKLEKQVVSGETGKKNNKIKIETVKEIKRTKNGKKTSDLDSISVKSEGTLMSKVKIEITQPVEKVNKKNSIEKPKDSKNKKKSAKNNLKVKSEEIKPKTRSQSTKEEKSETPDTKPSTRSKSTSQLDPKKNNTPVKKRISLSLRKGSNNNLPEISQLDGANDTDSDEEPTTSKKPKKCPKHQLDPQKNNTPVKKRISLSLRSRNNNLPELSQLDGANDTDSDEEPTTSKNPKKSTKKQESKRTPMKRKYNRFDHTNINSDDDFIPRPPKRFYQNKSKSTSSEDPKPKRKSTVKNRRSQNQNDDDSDYTPEISKKKKDNSDDEFHESKEKTKQRNRPKKDADDVEPKPKKGFDIWVEVYLENEKQWIGVDVVKGEVHCSKELHTRASHPITYIVAWNNDNSIKDITQRYCPKWNTVTRKLRIKKQWWDDTIKPFEGQKSECDKKEDEELAQIQLEKPLPTTIHEYKNHPIYVLRRHLLKFEALYPREPVILGFVRKEAVYSRDCVHRLRTREYWFKQAKVVRPGEEPYKIVKTIKYDKIRREFLKDQPLDIFGIWQVDDYVPPTAENGIVPRNEYGNVELFKTCMLPKGTVHLQLPGLNKLARRMNIDCAPAMVGFDFHSGWNHPVFDGYVVCEEYSESLIAAWYLEEEEQEKREQEKLEKRVYGNWKKLIKGLLIRERLKARYNFGEPSEVETGTKKRKSKGPKFVSKKRRQCSENESDSECAWKVY